MPELMEHIVSCTTKYLTACFTVCLTVWLKWEQLLLSYSFFSSQSFFYSSLDSSLVVIQLTTRMLAKMLRMSRKNSNLLLFLSDSKYWLEQCFSSDIVMKSVTSRSKLTDTEGVNCYQAIIVFCCYKLIIND